MFTLGFFDDRPAKYFATGPELSDYLWREFGATHHCNFVIFRDTPDEWFVPVAVVLFDDPLDQPIGKRSSDVNCPSRTLANPHEGIMPSSSSDGDSPQRPAAPKT